MKYKIEVKGKLGECDVSVLLEGEDTQELVPIMQTVAPAIIEALAKKEEAHVAAM